MRRQIASAPDLELMALPVSCLIRNLRANRIHVRLGSNQTNAKPMIFSPNHISQEKRRSVVLGNQQIHGSIIVKISQSQAARREWLRESRTTLLAYILKSLASVAKQQHGFPELYAFNSLLHRVVWMTIAEQQIKIAVIVVIEKLQTPAAHQPCRHADPVGVGNVSENFILVILVERVHLLIDVCLNKADPAILIVIPRVHAHAGTWLAEAA